MSFFLYHKRSQITGSVIASALDIEHGLSIPSALEGNLIRWGNRTYSGPLPTGVIVFNSRQALERASDKLATLEILQDAGVTVPEWNVDPTELEFPFLGRRVQHARGTDVVLCLQKGDYLRKPRDYYVKYIPTAREYRVHVAFGEVIRIQGKFCDDASLAVPWIRNHAHGYRFRNPKKRINRERQNQAVRAVEALGLDFGAVDLLIGDDRLTYVLEVNTAPACSPLTAAAYVTAFAKKMGIDTDQVEWDRLNLLSPDQEDGDTDDEVEGEEENDILDDILDGVFGTAENPAPGSFLAEVVANAGDDSQCDCESGSPCQGKENCYISDDVPFAFGPGVVVNPAVFSDEQPERSPRGGGFWREGERV